MAAEPVAWRADGVPYSERFDDIYHTETGALAQSRHVFLRGCGLPEAWAGRPQWRILETGFGLGLNFLTSWQAWRADVNRPRLLHFVSVEAYPVGAEDLLRAAEAYPELAPLAKELTAQWQGLLPGFHRLAFDQGQVLLTLCIGDVQAMLRAQRFEADSIFLDGFSPQQNPAMWSPDTLKAVSRFARQGTGLATWTYARPVRDVLSQNGFQLERREGLPPKRDCLAGVFAPAWTVRRRGPAPERVDVAGRCAVIGAGLAGAAVASSLARRGWKVTVLDAADHPAAGASGLPVGVMAPHVSPDDALLSRLTRAGIRATWLELERLLEQGRDWRAGGVLERRPEGDTRVPAGWSDSGPNESWPASTAQLAQTGLPANTPALWHARAGWVRPSRLIEAWMREPGVEFRGNAAVARVSHRAAVWQLFGEDGRLLDEADRIVVAAGYQSGRFAPLLPLQPVRGQVAWGRMTDDLAVPATPLNGDGHLIAYVPEGEGALLWLAGATFDRDSTDLEPNGADAAANRERLKQLHPAAAAALATSFDRGEVNAWVGVRCASGDRRPLVGPLGEDGLWACTALGSRGLSFAALCGELLAAQWHGEPLPLPANLAKALGTQRTEV
ncbi:FAD-dependent cmnm(5)s(2)U34 oxidoreductase [Variovorax sp. Root318D1]|uniref:FAD-dependent 5-carboxymethylaminomethyl-2-thiouridine(34) oxidoreductase MnmC n=1 Tax=Variovorax sp. Root318D1 TaxID=1736513 RepID=UPI0006F1E5B1|nr:FAD-dependent 5-carboxymethylaminomethyl-2-thiouridine(34) oxidoreductase MnmC [Variovorax sp. Root318D1]KQU83723.1 FAD-dependent cmnm(5)s(2)U34 oxidoreductase [Variovorax sp. Root318D1]